MTDFFIESLEWKNYKSKITNLEIYIPVYLEIYVPV